MRNFDDGSCYMIAEIGVNHGGSLELAKKMITAARESGADAVKFQTFTAESLVTPGTDKVFYQKDTTSDEESHYDMISKLELSREAQRELKTFCYSTGLDFISTPYDIEGARFLVGLDVSLLKTASADLVDIPLHEYLASTGVHVLIATGMASLGEIERTVSVYQKAQDVVAPNISLLHCVSNYPCKAGSLNLSVIPMLKNTFGCHIGYSDHSIGSQAAIISVSLGARVVEKHFTIDKSLPGPDHKASSTPDEFRELVDAVRKTEEALGVPVKTCQSEEAGMMRISRKSVVLNKPISVGEILTREYLTMKRPGTGLPATEIPRLLGKKVHKDLPENHLLSWCDICE